MWRTCSLVDYVSPRAKLAQIGDFKISPADLFYIAANVIGSRLGDPMWRTVEVSHIGLPRPKAFCKGMA